jgi:hypothetical protein
MFDWLGQYCSGNVNAGAALEYCTMLTYTHFMLHIALKLNSACFVYFVVSFTSEEPILEELCHHCQHKQFECRSKN